MAARAEPVATIEDSEAPSPIRAAYLERTQNSAEAHATAETVMPGGNSRQAGYWAPYPLTIDRAEGVHLWDVDGHRSAELLFSTTEGGGASDRGTAQSRCARVTKPSSSISRNCWYSKQVAHD